MLSGSLRLESAHCPPTSEMVRTMEFDCSDPEPIPSRTIRHPSQDILVGALSHPFPRPVASARVENYMVHSVDESVPKVYCRLHAATEHRMPCTSLSDANEAKHGPVESTFWGWALRLNQKRSSSSADSVGDRLSSGV